MLGMVGAELCGELSVSNVSAYLYDVVVRTCPYRPDSNTLRNTKYFVSTRASTVGLLFVLDKVDDLHA